MFSERTGAELNQMAEEAKRRAEIARLVFNFLKNHLLLNQYYLHLDEDISC